MIISRRNIKQAKEIFIKLSKKYDQESKIKSAIDTVIDELENTQKYNPNNNINNSELKIKN